jgi:ribosomal protein L11 methyltransferase
MPWIQINATVSDSLAEPLSDAFMEANAASVTFSDALDQPIYEPEIGTTEVWQQTKVTALYDAEVETSPIIDQVLSVLPSLKIEQFKIEQLEDKDWVRAWMDQFQPMQFGENLWIIPSWINKETLPNTDNKRAINLFLDPGMAFGTGTHPTTSLCLSWLDQNPPTNKTVIDYGCGSGILALAACKLGSKQVKGTDIDPQAITAGIENSQRNNENIDFKLVKNFDSQPVDLLIANILSGPLKELMPEFSKLIKAGGSLVISGLLSTQSENLINFYQQNNFVFVEQNDLDGWSQLSFIKK